MRLGKIGFIGNGGFVYPDNGDIPMGVYYAREEDGQFIDHHGVPMWIKRDESGGFLHPVDIDVYEPVGKLPQVIAITNSMLVGLFEQHS